MTYYFFGNQTNQPSEALLAKAGIISNKKGQERDQPRVYLSQTRKQEVKEAIESDEAPGATEAKRAPIKEEKTKKQKEKKQKEKKKQKTNFPPGLVVSEKAKEKMAKIQIKITEKQTKQAEKKREQQERWERRDDVIQKWEEQEQKQVEETDKILEQWDEEDAIKAEVRQAEIKEAITPEAQQELEHTYANEDGDGTLQRAEVIAKVEEENLVVIEKREKEQLRRDRVYNFFVIITRKPRREVPEDLPYGLGTETWALVLIVAFITYILTKD